MNKINLPAGQLERFHNPKSPQDYIARIDTILQQKDEIFEILHRLAQQPPAPIAPSGCAGRFHRFSER